MEEQNESKIIQEIKKIINNLNEKFGNVWQTYVTIAGILILSVALVIYFINSYSQTKKGYWEKISMAQGYAFQGMTNQSIQILDDVIIKYSNSEIAQHARLSKANISFDTKNYNLAAKVYQEVINTGKQKSIIPFAYIGLGQSKENLMDFQGAETVYKEAIEKFPEHFIAPRIYDSLARVYLLMNKLDEAKLVYERLVTLYPGTYWSSIAQRISFAQTQAPKPQSQP
ncbi:MAG: tetratricopeptide repeat protein [Elusimicrobiota bacterium]